jgi:hypothetical protein
VVNTTRKTGCKLKKGTTAAVAACWCGMKDQARAQAVFAKLAGAERESARAQCAVEGIQLR